MPLNEPFRPQLHSLWRVDSHSHPLRCLRGRGPSFGLDETNCQVHLTGGNQLMAMAAAEWCRLAGIPCFYLERDLRVFPDEPASLDQLRSLAATRSRATS